MTIDKSIWMVRGSLLAAAMAATLAGCAGSANTPPANDRADVTAAAERLRVAMVDPSAAVLDAVVAEQLSYGHSGGRVDTKQSFIGDLVNGKSDFVTLDLTDQTVVLTGDVALIRHALNAKTNDAGTPGAVSLKVLQVWQRQGGQWKLVARQAVRTPT